MSQPSKTGQHTQAKPSETIDNPSSPKAETPQPDLGGTVDFSVKPVTADPTATVDLDSEQKLNDTSKQLDKPALAATFDSDVGAQPGSDFHTEGNLFVGGKTLVKPDADGDGAGSGPERPVVAGYEILGELGRGGMGVVYKALQTKLNRIVALKMVLAGAHAGKDQLARFNLEAQAVAHLQHPNIIQIYEVGEHSGLPYFSLEFIDGGSLSDKTEGKPQEPLEAADMIERLARAMQHAHEHGIVHRDLKPMNVLLMRDGTPKITDFGLAKRLEGESSSQTRSGAILGTPSYMAPEQAMGEIEKIGPLTDVYALGAMLYELVTGRPPFLAATPMDTVIQVTKDEPVPPTQLQPKLPRDVETICLKCLQKEQLKRYTSAGELADDLHRFLQGETILARPVSTPERLWRWCRRNPRTASLSAAVAILLLFSSIVSSAAYLQIRQQKSEIERERNSAVEARNLAQQNAELARQKAEDEKIARDLADKSAEAALKAQLEAEENAKVAVDQGSLAINTLYNVVTKVQNQLREQPGAGMQKLRQDLLSDAMQGLRNVVNTATGSAIVGRTRAAAFQRMGDIARELGNSEEALTHYRESQTIIEGMYRQNPELIANVFNLGTILEKLGDVSSQLEDLSIARDYYRRSLEHRLVLRQMELKDPKVTAKMVSDSLGRAYLKQGELALSVGDPPSAWNSIQQYLELQEGKRFDSVVAVLTASKQEKGLTKSYPSGFVMLLGQLSFRLNEPNTACEFYEIGVRMNEESLNRNPFDHNLRRSVASAYGALGDLELQQEEPDLAKSHYLRAYEIYQAILAEDPETAVNRRNASMSHYRLATVALVIEDNTAAQHHFEECLKLRDELAKADPRNSHKLIDLMISLSRCGRHKEAADMAERLCPRAEQDPSILFNIACGYALCFGAVAEGRQNGGELTADDRTSQASYTASALNAIDQAIQQGYRDVVGLERDPDLAPIRSNPQFIQFITSLKKSQN